MDFFLHSGGMIEKERVPELINPPELVPSSTLMDRNNEKAPRLGRFCIFPPSIINLTVLLWGEIAATLLLKNIVSYLLLVLYGYILVSDRK